MTRHDTPLEVANALAKHAPKRIVRLLEPAVGAGLLLKPFEKLSKKALKRVVCIDIDRKALNEVKSKFNALDARLQTICADFLEWRVVKQSLTGAHLFDCILMNPPFDARKTSFVSVELVSETGTEKVKTSLEAAFVLRALDLLSPKGTLLAILPSSFIASISNTCVRNYLMTVGSVRCVHELPPFTFSGVEGRVYLFVFEKSSRRSSLLLCNHDLNQPQRMTVPRARLTSTARLDYRYYEAVQKYQELKSSSAHLGWKSVSTLAKIYRGSLKSPKGPRRGVHTSDYKDGFWQVSNKKKILKDVSSHGIKREDLLLKRVGRNCSQSLGRVIGHIGESSSDCVLIIRPNNPKASIALLLQLRVVMTSDFGKALFENGTGASYLTEHGICETSVPTRLGRYFVSYLRKYTVAVKNRNFLKMVEIENDLRALLGSAEH